ncbi:MAG: RdgB/HAM1 family non-canonical purine NTP pyrophosphatase [Lewinellaceae bacterium]|nr:RdgB/HAM1 family non-canonical purine NTP pyrophosphatase [Lewinellaceae bacterium]
MQTLIFATGNPHKVEEVNQVLSDAWDLHSMAEWGITEDLPENQDTLEGNALEKARYVYEKLKLDCFAEDTGLEVEALHGEPGVYTARYAGDSKDPNANIQKVLDKLAGAGNRRARFRTVIALIIKGEEFLFEGIAPGTIQMEKSGNGGFGYDPIFRPEGYLVSFAEMDAATKNRISHRGQAVRKLIAFLEERASKTLH